MSGWVWLVVAMLAVLAVVLVIGRRVAHPGVDPTQLLLDPTLMGRVRTLAQSGQKIQAIKELRDGNPGLGLASAKAMVDRMAAAPGIPAPSVPLEDRLPSASSIPLELELEIRAIKEQGTAIEAIKMVRQRTGMGLKDAKRYVDGL